MSPTLLTALAGLPNSIPRMHPLADTIKPKIPHAPYPPLPNPSPSAADWTSKLKNIHKSTSVPITHPPSMMRNAKSKSKSIKDSLDKAAISYLMIVDPPSTSKPKPKSVSDPLNDNNTNKEAHEVNKIAQNEEKQQCSPNHSNKHNDEENDNDKNGYDNHDVNDQNGHVNDDENQNASVPPFLHTNSHRKSIPPFLSKMLHWKMPLYPLFSTLSHSLSPISL
jgi:hypothetical protein